MIFKTKLYKLWLKLYCLETNEVGLKLYRNLQFKEGKDLYSNRTKSIKFTKK